MIRRWSPGLRWGVCFALALGFHAAGAAALLARWNDHADLVANAPMITVSIVISANRTGTNNIAVSEENLCFLIIILFGYPFFK